MYCIEAYNECGNSTTSCNPGSLLESPSQPSNVSATDGDYSNQVLVNWTTVVGAEEYKIYRDGSWIGIVSGGLTQYIDLIPEQATKINIVI